MCGIVGFIGKNAVKTAIEKLKLLQYRGYDSVGVGFVENGAILTEKAVGKVEALSIKSEAECAIAHTRWATHGKVCTRNAHPHASGENWAIVHNGIIENYAELSTGKTVSDTDSEVIAQLLEKYGEGLDSVLATAEKLEGAFAVLAIEKSGKMYAMKQKSPLFASEKNGEIAFASDPVCFCGFSDTYYTFCDQECAVAGENGIEFYDFSGEKLHKEPQPFAIEYRASGKGSFDTFMQKEIYDIPLAQSRIEQTYSTAFVSEAVRDMRCADEVWFIGCGTAYHACLFAVCAFEKAGIRCRAFIASEFRYSDVMPTKNTVCVFVSQSGETADTLGALEKVASTCKTVALTNVGYSSLASAVNVCLPTLAGEERAVASTKAYACQICIFDILARALRNCDSAMHKLDKAELDRILKKAERVAESFDKAELFVLGRKADYVTACECALKVKEVSYVNANAYPTGELKHGFIALIEEGSEVLIFATDPALYKKNLSGALECASRGAKITVVTTDPAQFENVGKVVEVSSYLSSVAFSFAFALACAKKRNCDPDMPRNLAKSVTVE